MTARLMKLSGLAETLPVERTRKPARPAAKPAATRRRAPAAKPAVALDVASTPGQSCRPRASAVAVAFAGWLSCRWASSFSSRPPPWRPSSCSTRSTGARPERPPRCPLRSSRPLRARTTAPSTGRARSPHGQLEVTTTSVGTYVRYLPLNAPVGDSARAITVGTYPMRNAYATAVSRAKTPAMTSRETSGGGLVVWSQKLPTSVYVAFPGVPHLVEVYAPDADDARTLALSGHIRPVR